MPVCRLSVSRVSPPERIGKIAGGNLLVRTGADPGLGGMTVAAVLESLDEVAEAPAQHGSGGGAAEEAAQAAREDIAQPASRSGAAGRGSRPAAEQSAEDIAKPAARIAGLRLTAGRQAGRLARTAGVGGLAAAALERLVGQKPQQRQHDRRHSAPATAAGGWALAARAVLHTGQDIAQSHMCLLL